MANKEMETTPTTVLIVDDDPMILRLLISFLEGAGFRCRTAENAEQARQIFSELPLDLLLTDLDMPGDSGLDLIRYANGNFVLIYLFSMAAGWVLLRGIWRLLAGLSTLLCAAVLVMLGSDALYAVALLVALLLLDHLRARHKALA